MLRGGDTHLASETPERRSIIEIFPVTILLALQYGALVAIPAVLHDTAPESTILEICGLGVLVGFVVEGIRAPVGNRPRLETSSDRSRGSVGYRELPATWRGALAVMIVGWMAAWAAAFAGHGTFATQIGTTSTSKYAALLTPFSAWPLIGLAVTLGLRRDRRISNRVAFIALGVSLALQLAISIYYARLAPFMSFALAVAFLAIATRMVRLRWVVLAVLLIPLVWPVLYGYRNQLRVQEGEVVNPYATNVPSQRLRLDLEMAQLALLPNIPADIGQPSLPTLLRFGLIPRTFDSGRGTINTASGLSLALGEPADNSDTVTALGFAYVENGWGGIIVYVGISSLIVGIVIRRRGPWALAMLAVIVQSGIWIESVWPDMISDILQAFISLLAAVIFVAVFFRFDAASKPTFQALPQ